MYQFKMLVDTLFKHNTIITITNATLTIGPTCFNPYRVIFRGIALFALQPKSLQVARRLSDYYV
jgi:hypothetical protein